MFKYLLYHDLVPLFIKSCTSNSVFEKYSRHSYQLCQARVCKCLLTCTLICEIRLTNANSPTFHSILSMYYHTINMHKICFFIVVSVQMNSQSHKLCDLVMTQDKLHD
jgi:hypothetical protein